MNAPAEPSRAASPPLALHVEIVGATSVGKSTLMRALDEACRRRGLELATGDQLALAPLGLRHFRNEFVVRRLVDAPALLACLRARRRHRALIGFCLEACRRAPAGITGRLNLARNALRKIGLFEIVRRGGAGRLVVVDNEGVLQGAHNLFVHVDGQTLEEEDVRAFLRLAPLPDAVVCVRQDLPVLVDRTLVRGHRRIPAGSREAATRFVARALAVFDIVTREPLVRARLLTVEPGGSVRIAPEAEGDRRLGRLATLLSEAVSIAQATFRARAKGDA